MRRTFRLSPASTKSLCLIFRFALFERRTSMCLWFALFLFNLPDAVSLNRFAAPRLVFIFGIINPLLFGR